MAEGLRITGGLHRGRKLPRAPEGVRPTAGRVREAYFNILGQTIVGSSFLDLFAGSGLMSLEASSRGASRVTSVEIDPEIAARISAIAARVGADFDVATRDSFDFLSEASAGFDLVYADPPWKFQQWSKLVSALHDSLAVGSGTIVAIEHPSRSPIADAAAQFRRVETRTWGDTAITFLEREATE